MISKLVYNNYMMIFSQRSQEEKGREIGKGIK